MASLSSYATSQLPKLARLYPTQFAKFSDALSDVPPTLEPGLRDVIASLKSWETSITAGTIKGILTTAYQGVMLGASVPNCSTLFSGNGFVAYVNGLSSSFKYTVANTTPQQLAELAERFGDLDDGVDFKNIQNLQRIVSDSSADRIYRSLFRPGDSSYTPSNPSAKNILDTVLITKGYNYLLDTMDTSIPKPMY